MRAYPAAPEGAGYKADIVNMMVGERDRWFRPADVCVAPDGSLYVTDWYDPGVGGHNMQDMERGRLFRLAPPGAKYSIPKFDFDSPAGAVKALANPSNSVRYLAFQAIQKFGDKAVDALKTMAADANPRMRARAIWALGKLPAHGEEAVAMAMKDQDPNLRMVAIRLSRQLDRSPKTYASLLRDPSPAVRREFAVALHLDKSNDMPKWWAELASQYDGHDRWYLEALGIGAGQRWTECFDAYQQLTGNSADSPAARDIAWRARCAQSALAVAGFILNPSVNANEVPRFFRSLDFQAPADRQSAIETLLSRVGKSGLDEPRRDQIVVECLSRTVGDDVKLKPDQKEAVDRYLSRCTNRSEKLKLIRQLKLPNANELLLAMIVEAEPDTQSVAATEMLLRRNSANKLVALMSNKDRLSEAERVGTVVGMCKLDASQKAIDEMLTGKEIADEAKVAICRALAGSDAGARWLLARTKDGKLPAAARLIVGSRLRSSGNPDIRQQANELFPAPRSAAKDPLPPINELVQRKGNVDAGREVFKAKGTCANCHVVAGAGKVIGPDLSEIGGKLSREAMLVSILDPSAGISHNFENYAALTNDGQVINGLLVSRTESGVVIKDAQGIERTIPSGELDTVKKLDKSLMPDNIHENLSTQELVDLIEYLMTLKKK